MIHGTISGAITAPMLVPELKRPVANARSFNGNHSATALIAAGKVAGLADAEREPGRDEARHRRRIREAKHTQQGGHGRTVRRGFRVGHRRDTPHAHRNRKANPGADAIDESTRQQQPDRIRQLETEDDVGVVDLTPAVLLLQRRLEQADHLAIDVVDRRGEEQQEADHPAIPPDARGGGGDRRGCARRWSLRGACSVVVITMSASLPSVA